MPDERLVSWVQTTLESLPQPSGSSDSSFVSSVEISYFPCGTGTIRGLRACKDIAPKGTVLRIPYRLFLTADAVITRLAPPQFAVDIASIEALLDTQGKRNPITAPMENASTLLASCEHVLALFLLLERFAHIGSSFATYVAALPSVMDTSTPEMWMVLESASCPSAYFDDDDEVKTYRSSMASEGRLLDEASMVGMLGSRVRFNKVLRRTERQYQRFIGLRDTYLVPHAVASSEDDVDPSSLWLHNAAKSFSFCKWLWATHMVNSRSFMYRRPSWSDYPTRYQFASGEHDSEDEDDDDDDASTLRAIEKAKEEHRRRFAEDQRPRSISEQNSVVLSRAEALQADEASKRTSRIGGASVATEEEEDDSDDEDSSSTTSDTSEPDLLAMVPFADMFNHCPVSGTSDFSFDKHSCDLIVKADTPIFKGDEVCIKYNSMDHWRFAKYYGFVALPRANTDPHFVSLTDAFPIAPPPPPTSEVVTTTTTTSTTATAREKDQPNANSWSMLATTKAQLFEGRQLKRHCYTTSRGPNQQLQSVMRLAMLNAEDLNRLAAAYNKEPLSIRNEWHVFEYLKNELQLRKKEIERNMKSFATPPSVAPGLTCRGNTIIAVRSRDFDVVDKALSACKTKFEQLCSIMFYGGSSSDSLRNNNLIHKQFERLKNSRQVPSSAEAQSAMNISLMPPLYRRVAAVAASSSSHQNASRGLPKHISTVFDDLTKQLRERLQKVSSHHVDPSQSSVIPS